MDSSIDLYTLLDDAIVLQHVGDAAINITSLANLLKLLISFVMKQNDVTMLRDVLGVPTIEDRCSMLEKNNKQAIEKLRDDVEEAMASQDMKLVDVMKKVGAGQVEVDQIKGDIERFSGKAKDLERGVWHVAKVVGLPSHSVSDIIGNREDGAVEEVEDTDNQKEEKVEHGTKYRGDIGVVLGKAKDLEGGVRHVADDVGLADHAVLHGIGSREDGAVEELKDTDEQKEEKVEHGKKSRVGGRDKPGFVMAEIHAPSTSDVAGSDQPHLEAPVIDSHKKSSATTGILKQIDVLVEDMDGLQKKVDDMCKFVVSCERRRSSGDFSTVTDLFGRKMETKSLAFDKEKYDKKICLNDEDMELSIPSGSVKETEMAYETQAADADDDEKYAIEPDAKETKERMSRPVAKLLNEMGKWKKRINSLERYNKYFAHEKDVQNLKSRVSKLENNFSNLIIDDGKRRLDKEPDDATAATGEDKKTFSEVGPDQETYAQTRKNEGVDKVATWQHDILVLNNTLADFATYLQRHDEDIEALKRKDIAERNASGVFYDAHVANGQFPHPRLEDDQDFVSNRLQHLEKRLLALECSTYGYDYVYQYYPEAEYCGSIMGQKEAGGQSVVDNLAFPPTALHIKSEGDSGGQGVVDNLESHPTDGHIKSEEESGGQSVVDNLASHPTPLHIKSEEESGGQSVVDNLAFPPTALHIKSDLPTVYQQGTLARQGRTTTSLGREEAGFSKLEAGDKPNILAGLALLTTKVADLKKRVDKVEKLHGRSSLDDAERCQLEQKLMSVQSLLEEKLEPLGKKMRWTGNVDALKKRIKKLEEVLEKLMINDGRDGLSVEAAGLCRRILIDFECLSCGRPSHGVVRDPHNICLPRLGPGARPHHSHAPKNTYLMGNIRSKLRCSNINI